MSLLNSMSLRHSAARSLHAGKAVDVRADDRVCQEPSCRTRLSRYNPAPACSLHEGWDDAPRTRGSES